MNKVYWNIWDAASYDIVNLMLNEGELLNLKRILKKGKKFPVILNNFNSQTPCALAMQFTGKDSYFLDIGGYNTPEYKSLNDPTSYQPTFCRRNVGKYVAWHQKYIGKKKIGLLQIPFSQDEINEVYWLDGFSKKRDSFKLIYENEFVWSDSDNAKIAKIIICNKMYILSLIRESQCIIVVVKDTKSLKEIKIVCDENRANDVWISPYIGFKIFAFTDENNQAFIFFTDTWEYSTKNLKIDNKFRSEVGVFMGKAYGRLYRKGKFGKPFYDGGKGKAEEIYFTLLGCVSECFTSINMWLMNKYDLPIIISYQPCIDEASHEFYGWWKNSEDTEKKYFWTLLKRAYAFADNHLGHILDKMESADSIMVTSDHGIYSVSYEFYLNEYLKRKKLLFCTDNNKIDPENSLIYYHPAETGAVYFNKLCTANEIENIIKILSELVIDGKHVIKQFIKTENKVMGDYFIIPGDEINIKSKFGSHMINKTPKTGCHTVNNYKSSMHAICFVSGRNVDSLPKSGDEISYKLISDIFKKEVTSDSICSEH